MSGTDYTLTPNLGLYKPIYDKDDGQWGAHLNGNADVLDSALSTGAGGMFLPIAGGVMSGALSLAGNATSALHAVPLQQLTAATAGGPFLPISYTATGGTVARTAQDRAATATLTVEDFGAKGDATTDDTAAFNAYANYLRGLTGYFGYKQFSLGASRAYVIVGSVNLTNLSDTIFEGNGSTIIASPTVAGTVCLDAIQSYWVFFQNFTLVSQSNNCKYGIQIGRALSPTAGGGSCSFSDMRMLGSFSAAGIYNRAAESSNFVNLTIQNQNNSATSYAIIMDGDCSFPITSQFAATYNPGNPTVADGQAPGALQSFNQQTFVGCSLVSQYGPGLWMSGLRGHKYFNSYVVGYGQGGSGPAAILSYAAGGAIDDLYWDVHVEPSTLASAFRVVGAVAAPVIRTLYVRDYFIMGTVAVFTLGAGVTSLTIHDLEMHIDHTANSPMVVFDNPANYTVLGGQAYVGPNINFNVPITQGWINSNGTFPAAFNTGGATTVPGALTVSGGASFGSLTGSSNTDLSKHIALWGTANGFSVTGGRMNYNAGSGTSHVLLVNGADVLAVGAGQVTANQLLYFGAGAQVAGGFLLVQSSAAISASGSYVTWNRSGGQGEMHLLCQKGGGSTGGFRFSDVTGANVATQLASLTTTEFDVNVPTKLIGTVGFNNTVPIAKPTLSGAWAGNTAGKALATLLASYGLLTDSSTA
jgi:hypothetical protein